MVQIKLALISSCIIFLLTGCSDSSEPKHLTAESIRICDDIMYESMEKEEAIVAYYLTIIEVSDYGLFCSGSVNLKANQRRPTDSIFSIDYQVIDIKYKSDTEQWEFIPKSVFRDRNFIYGSGYLSITSETMSKLKRYIEVIDGRFESFEFKPTLITSYKVGRGVGVNLQGMNEDGSYSSITVESHSDVVQYDVSYFSGDKNIVEKVTQSKRELKNKM